MSEPSAFGFGPFVPGFDFFKNLSKTAAPTPPAEAPGMPGMASWVAPTLNIEDMDKRIQELKSVLFWLEQNTTALKATIQAMEVQKMTLTTLQSMNVNMADLAKAFMVKPPVAEPDAEVQAVTETPSEASEPAPALEDSTATEAGKPAVDPMQWWGALSQQFQGIAAAALKDVAGEALKAGRATKTTQAAAKAKATTARQQATGTSQEKIARAAPVKAARVPPKSATQPATTAARRKAAKK